MSADWSLSEDLSTATTIAIVVLVVVAGALLLVELRTRERGGILIAATGLLSALLFGVAVLRPVTVNLRGTVVGPRVVILVDQSRRLLLPSGDKTRRDRAFAAVEELRRRLGHARLSVLGFGEGAPTPLPPGDGGRLTTESDLVAALRHIAETPGERPQAVVVLSDGRLSRPSETADDAALRQSLGDLGIPVHTVALERRAPRDASVRSVRAAGAAVAHQPLVLDVEIGCAGGLSCDEIPVSVRELRHGVEPAELAQGRAKLTDGKGTVELEVTLDRAGARVIEVAIEPPKGDEIADNDRRLLTFVVARERVRLLHLAGRPTYDVRALRLWLKSDEATDVVAFFILRGHTDDPGAEDDELALIEFPVDELFTVHLSSFDAIILQDIDAVEYKLSQYLPSLAQYVEAGGGLIMVGGPSSFAGGSYARTQLDRVLPIEPPQSQEPFDSAEFVPRYTEAGRAAPVTRALRELLGDGLPSMAGSNWLGPLRAAAIALWEHPKLLAAEKPMPVLALGEAGDGRTIALGADATHELAFGEQAAEVAGRSYGALWDGLLGWLMRDPRFEAARVELVGECIAGMPATLRVLRLPGMEGNVELSLERLGADKTPPVRLEGRGSASGPVDMTVERLEPGGYTGRVRLGAAPATRHDFACERGGAAWSDSRPDPERLEKIARATAAVSTAPGDVDEIPWPASTEVAAERRVSPVLPPWAWTLAASVFLGAHWIARRRGGLV